MNPTLPITVDFRRTSPIPVKDWGIGVGSGLGHRDSSAAIGAFGQQFNVHPQGRVVVAKFSSLCSMDSRTTLRKDALQRIGMRDLTERIAAEC